MNGFIGGILAGLLVSLALGAVGGIFLYRRLVRLERRARQAERLAELGTLTGALAHELKNPLSTVKLNLQLLQEDLDPQHPAYTRLVNRLNTVQREASRLAEILDQFLKHAGKLELHPRCIELNAMLQDLVDFFSPTAQSQRVQLRLNRMNGELSATVDAKLLQQAILNLMINALHAMPHGGELILSLKRNGSYAVIDVIDTGTGIPADKVGKIFQPYFSTKAGGTGLGLAMAKRIIDEHGGNIAVKSEVGKGSDFTVSVPLK
jgi:signal transduction histidine kinase